MVTDTLNKRVTKTYAPETWTKAQELYQGGMSLGAVGKELGIPYPTVRYHAWMEDWGVRAKGVKRDPRLEAARAKKLARKLKREEALMIAQTSLAKTEDLEVLAHKCLKADSARMKVMVSRVVSGLISRLEDPTIPPRSAAQALGALAPIFRLLYRWRDEPGPPADGACGDQLRRGRTSRNPNRRGQSRLNQHHTGTISGAGQGEVRPA